MGRNGDVFKFCPAVIPSERKSKKFSVKNKFNHSGGFVYALIIIVYLVHVVITKRR